MFSQYWAGVPQLSNRRPSLITQRAWNILCAFIKNDRAAGKETAYLSGVKLIQISHMGSVGKRF